MVRLGAVFVAVCIILIAGSLGVGAYLYFGVSGAEAALVGLALLTALGLYNTITSRLRDRSDVGAQIADLSRGSADLARQVAELGRRVATIEGRVDASQVKSRTIADPIAAELGELGTLVKQLADTVAAHDTAIKSGVPATVAPALTGAVGRSPVPEAVPSPPPLPRATLASSASPSLATQTATSLPTDQGMGEQVRVAVEAGRIDLYLQPIVTLPQRKVRYYEALSRMRNESGDVIAAADFLDDAETAGLMGKIDNLALFRSVQVVRRLMMKNREIGMFCNIASATLADSDFFPQLVEFVEANRALASARVGRPPD